MKLSRFIVFDVPSEARLVIEWAGIEARLRHSGPSRAARAVLALAPLAAAAALAMWLRRPTASGASALDGAVFGSDTGSAGVELRDGSHIEVEPHARLAVLRGDPQAVRVELRGGAARFEVSHVEQRSFVVEAGGVEIRVVGTRFRVGLDGESRRVKVAVDRGAVEVRRRGDGEIVQRLAAGEESTLRADGTPSVEEPVPPPPTLETTVAPSLVVAPENRAADAPLGEPAGKDARKLFDAATAARRAGKNTQAAELFDAVRRKYPNDPRAGLAAFELGRLRMDALGDLPGAMEAFSSAMASSPSGSVREDAQARLVYAADAMHDDAKCRAMRRAYLARYPAGAHALNVQSKCGGGP